MVVLFHFRPLLREAAPGFSDALAPVLNCGAQGVDLFFILSGLVLTWNYLDRMGPSFSARATLHFLWLRLARVRPVYLVTLHLAALWIIFTGPSSAEAWPFTAGRKPIPFCGPRSGPQLVGAVLLFDVLLDDGQGAPPQEAAK